MTQRIHASAPIGAILAAAAAAAPALADQPRPWEISFQEAASPVMERIVDLHNLLLVISAVIVVLVLSLIVYVAVRFNEKAHPAPTRTTHNTVLEVVWTALPVLILVVIAVPSFKLLYYMDTAQNPEMTLKVNGHQWYWSYEYPDNDNLTFDSNMVPEEDIKPGQARLLETDNRVVLPVNTDIRVLATASDVMHSWAVPAFGLKVDAIPGRANEAWVRITREGTFYGQCSELCGVNHGYMPITVEAVSKEAFARWVEEAKKKFARADGAAVRIAVTAAPAR